jgi:ketosteroid isomerase-like protein
MSQENVEIVRRSFELFSQGELDAWRETVDPDIGWAVKGQRGRS